MEERHTILSKDEIEEVLIERHTLPASAVWAPMWL